MTPQKTIFISHSTKDDARVDTIADWLEGAGFKVWVDHRNGIVPGVPSWDKAIRQAIDVADFGLFVMSDASLDSEICGSECLLVRELGDPLYVIKLEDVKPINVWLYIKQIQYVDLTVDFEAEMAKLVSALHGNPTADAPQPIRSKFTGESTLRLYLPYLFHHPMRGRDADLQRLTESLNGVVQVTGTGGLGKSRLVAEVALKHPAGAVWYRCSAVSSAAELFGLLQDHLQLPKDTSERDLLHRLSLNPRTLIVIDNAESVPPAQMPDYYSAIAKLQTAGAHVVITSRKRWEQLRPFKEITPVALDVASATAIARDFALSEGVALTDEQYRLIAEASRLYPYLIKLAIDQSRNRPFERVLEQLRGLKSKGVQEALDEMIRISLQQMTIQEGASPERLLMRLAVCQGTFDYQALTALKPDGMDEDELDDALDVLQAWRFVRYEGNDERYNVDAMVQISLPTPDDDAYRAYFDHYHALHSDYDRNQAHADDGSMLWHGKLMGDWENIQGALSWGLGHETEKAIDWVWALQHFMMLRRSHAEQINLLSQALDVARATGYVRGEGNSLLMLGDVHRMCNEYAEAVVRYEEALGLYRLLGARRGEANSLLALGDVHYMLDEYTEAVVRYKEALGLYRVIGDRQGEANSLRGLGDVHRMRNEYAEAAGHYEEAVKLYRAIGDRLGEANSLRGLGDVHRMLDEYADAVVRYEEALGLYRVIGDRQGEANSLRGLGDVHIRRNEYAEAVVRYEEAVKLYRVIGARLGEANSLKGLGDVHRMRNEYSEAVVRYEEAVGLYRVIGARLGEAHSLRALGDVHYMLDEYAEAVVRYEEARGLYRLIGDRLGEANSLQGLGDAHRMQNEYAEAVVRYDEAVGLGKHIGDFTAQLNSLMGLALVYHAQGNIPLACRKAQELLALADSHPFFKSHSIVDGWRSDFASWGCLGEG